MTAFLESTIGKLAVFLVDILCGLMAKGFHYLDEPDATTETEEAGR